ncbi:MAG: outer membrane beta-barrel protein [Candidatus Omnitrophica bacterium]|nr:outer membrane beta-barrel protein [Candidatus Omnitrophota bacterium]
MLTKKIISLVIFALFLSLGARTVRADFKLLDAMEEFGEKRFYKTSPTRLQAGPVRVHPTLRTVGTYDTNVLLEDQDNREDYIFNIQPGVVLELPINKHQVVVGYEADIEVFSKSRHARQNDQNQNMFALVDLNFPDFYVNVLEKFSETSGRGGTTFTERIPRYDQSINPKIGYRWNRFIFETGFRHFVRDFRRQVHDSLDFQLSEWTQVLYYEVFARLKALLEYQMAQIDYDDNYQRNGTFHQARIGFDGEIFPNFVVKARTGVQFRNYEESSETDFNGWVAGLAIDYDVRENLKLKLEFEREPIEATFGNVNFFTRHIFRGGLEYKIRPKWLAYSRVKYYRDTYAERSTIGTRVGYRRDDHTTLRLGVQYSPVDWWNLEAAWEYFRRDSNYSTLDYTDHRFTVSSTLAY